MTSEIVFRIIEIFLQVVLVIFAGMALFTWKRDIRGKDKYKLARALLEYVKDVRFLVHSKNSSWHQIYLNDILVDKNNFYSDQLALIQSEKVYFDQSIWGLFDHINTRSDLFLPKQVKIVLDELCPSSGKYISSDKNQYTYIQLGCVSLSKIKNLENNKNSEDGIYEMYATKNLTVREYFMKWERLLIELQKLT